MTTPGSAYDGPSKIQEPWFPASTLRQAGEGEGSRNRRVPSPIPESEEPVTVETNPSPPNKYKEGDRDQDTVPKEAGTLRHRRRGVGTAGQPDGRSRQ